MRCYIFLYCEMHMCTCTCIRRNSSHPTTFFFPSLECWHTETQYKQLLFFPGLQTPECVPEVSHAWVCSVPAEWLTLTLYYTFCLFVGFAWLFNLVEKQPRGGVEGKLLIDLAEHSCILLLCPNSACQTLVFHLFSLTQEGSEVEAALWSRPPPQWGANCLNSLISIHI